MLADSMNKETESKKARKQARPFGLITLLSEFVPSGFILQQLAQIFM